MAGLVLLLAGAAGVIWNEEVTFRAARIAKPRVPPIVLRPASRDYRVHTVCAATGLAALGLVLLARSLP